ncbi:MAG: hypothetical protein K2N84_05305 [Clostridia bacterium]|nr:hypothetical protein [Clostridia bacterium]
MTKVTVENIIKRYPYVTDAIKRGLSRTSFYIGNRKFVIDITEETKAVCELVKIIVAVEKSSLIKQMINEIIAGQSDVFIMMDLPYSKNVYYDKKKAIIEKVYKCCISRGLVSFEEILNEEIAS